MLPSSLFLTSPSSPSMHRRRHCRRSRIDIAIIVIRTSTSPLSSFVHRLAIVVAIVIVHGSTLFTRRGRHYRRSCVDITIVVASQGRHRRRRCCHHCRSRSCRRHHRCCCHCLHVTVSIEGPVKLRFRPGRRRLQALGPPRRGHCGQGCR